MNVSSNPIVSFISQFQQAEPILIGSFIIAVIVTFLAYYSKLMRNSWSKRSDNSEPFGYHWTDLMGTPEWNFSNSWATTITTLGAVLGTFLSSVEAIDQKTFRSGGVLGISLFFGLIVLIAPIVYSIFSVHKRVMDQGQEVPEYQGYVWMFTVICCITLWAVIGQLMAVTNTLNILIGSDAFLQTFFVVAVIVSILVVAGYAIKTMPWTIQDQLDKGKTSDAATHQSLENNKRIAGNPPQIEDQRPTEIQKKSSTALGSWPLL